MTLGLIQNVTTQEIGRTGQRWSEKYWAKSLYNLEGPIQGAGSIGLPRSGSRVWVEPGTSKGTTFCISISKTV
jgi:hypothetical protein